MENITFWAAVRTTFTRSAAFLTALPILGLVIVAVEGFQHVVESLDGMYASRAGMVSAGSDPHRLIAGTLKVFWLLLVGFWVIRFVASGSARVATRPSQTAIRRFAVVLLIMAVFSLMAIWPPALFAPGSQEHRQAVIAAGLAQLVTFPLGIALTPWLVGAALADRRAGPGFAIRRAWGSIWWALGVNLVVVLPLMVPHYVLSFLAVGKPAPVAGLILAIDALLVGYLGVVIGAVNVPVAARMAHRAGERLEVDPA